MSIERSNHRHKQVQLIMLIHHWNVVGDTITLCYKREREISLTYQNGMTTHRDHRRHVFHSKGGTRSRNYFFQFIRWYLIGSHELGNHLNRKFGIGQVFPRRQLGLAYGGKFVRNEQTSIAGQTLHDDRAKVEVLLTTSGAAISDTLRHGYCNGFVIYHFCGLF